MSGTQNAALSLLDHWTSISFKDNKKDIQTDLRVNASDKIIHSQREIIEGKRQKECLICHPFICFQTKNIVFFTFIN